MLRVLSAALSALVIVPAAPALAAPPATTLRVSVANDGSQGNGRTDSVFAFSADGRFVAFSSAASNLVPEDDHSSPDVFVRDLRSGTTTLVSVGVGGTRANDYSDRPSISGDGRYVAFVSHATNLVPGDTNGVSDVFVYDRQARRTVRVSVGADGAQANGDLTWREAPVISGDGRHVAFASDASNLVPGDTNGNGDLFVRDWRAARTTRVSVSTTGAQSDHYSREAAISHDGRYVAWVSASSQLDPEDHNGFDDVFLRDRVARTTTRISRPASGGEPNNTSYLPALSPSGRFVAFYSHASNLTPGDTNDDGDVFVYDRTARATELVSVSSAGVQGNYASWKPAISGNGRFVAFNSGASNLVPGDRNGRMDVFVRDRKAGTTVLVSLAADGTQGNALSQYPSISRDGRQVVFQSEATNLVSGDTNNAADLFLRRLP